MTDGQKKKVIISKKAALADRKISPKVWMTVMMAASLICAGAVKKNGQPDMALKN